MAGRPARTVGLGSMTGDLAGSTFLRLLPAVGLLALASWAVAAQAAVAGDSRLLALVEVLPILAGATALGLAWRFDQGRVVLALLVLAGAAVVLETHADDAALMAAIGLAVPLDLVVLLQVRERGLGSGRTITLAALLAAEVVLILSAVQAESRPIALGLSAALSTPGWAAESSLTPAALVVFACGLAAAILRVMARRDPIDTGLLGTLVAAYLGLEAISRPGGPRAYFGAGAFLLALAIVERSHALAYRDDLTGLPARRALSEELGRLDGCYTLAMVDIDHFKRLNDSRGHAVGDQVLRMVAARIAQVGGGGRAYRYGGEEFTLVFRGLGLREALPHLEAVRRGIATAPFALRASGRPRSKPRASAASAAAAERFAVTVSIGVSESGGQVAASDVIRGADRALYRAKGAGRNQVCRDRGAVREA